MNKIVYRLNPSPSFKLRLITVIATNMGGVEEEGELNPQVKKGNCDTMRFFCLLNNIIIIYLLNHLQRNNIIVTKFLKRRLITPPPFP